MGRRLAGEQNVLPLLGAHVLLLLLLLLKKSKAENTRHNGGNRRMRYLGIAGLTLRHQRQRYS